MSSEPSRRDKRYNFERIRTLLIKGFSDGELRDLCFDMPDFEPVYHQLAQNTGKVEIVRLLLEHTRQRLLVEQLLAQARDHNPTRYAAHEPYSLADANESPYRGLQYFDVHDAASFFGREALTTKLAAHLLPTSNSGEGGRNRFLAVIGASGSGKSSLVRAGLIPALNGGEPPANGYLSPNGSNRWLWHIITPTEYPLKKLATTLVSDPGEVKAANALVDALATDPRSLDTAIHQILGRISAKRLLLVVDQFEELFTVCKDEAERRAFVDNLMAATTSETTGPTTVVITLRADFYHHCAQYDTLRETLARSQEYIGPMTAEELRRAIEEPAQLAGYDFEPGLVDLLLHDMTDEPGALPLLSHALLETWQRCRKRTLTLEDYHESGGVGGAIAKTAETVYNQLTPEQKAIARRIFLAVTELGEGTQDTRRRAMLTELIPRLEEKPTVEALLKTLADSRLITTSEDTVEVAHEALIRKWPALRQWLDENREGLRIHRRLLEFAQEWNKNGHDSDYLYRGLRLDQAQAWAKTHVDEMGELEHDFLKASLAERKRLADEQAEQERRQAQIVRQRRIAIGLSFGLLVLAVLAIFAFEQRSQAIEQSNVAATARGQAELDRDLAVQSQQAAIVAQAEAEAENRVSSSRGLAADALINLPIDPELSILLAIEALAITHTTQAENALHRALQTSRIERTINDHTHWVYDIAFSPDGNYLATASFDGTAKVWDLASSQVLEALSGYEEIGLTSVAFNPGGTLLAVADGEGNVHLWDVTNRTQAFSQPLSIHSWIFDLTFSPDGTLLAIASTDGTTESGTATIWNIETGQIVYTLPHDAWICGIGFSPGGTRLITGSYDGTVKIWDTASGRLVKSLIHDIGGEVCGVAFSPVDGTLLVTAGQDQKVKIWNINADQPLLILSEHTNTVWRVAFSPDGERLATGSFDGTAKVWDATSGRLLSTLSGHRDRLRGIVFSSDGQHLATASEDGIVKIWNVGISQHEDEIRRVVFSPDGMRVATASLDKTASIWDVASGQRLRHLKGHQGPIQDVAFNPDGQRLATASDDGSVRLWDAETGRLLYKLSSDETPVLAVAFSPDKTFLAAAGMNEVTLWNVDTGQKLNTLAEHEGRIFSLAFHPDGQLLATAGEDQTVKLWNISTSELLHTLWHERSEIYRVAFSADGEKLATAGEDKTVKVWDVATGQKLFEISAQAERVLDVAFSKDGAYLVTASSDGTAKVWDISQVNNGQTLDTERLNLDHTRAVNSLAISPDGRRLATGGADQILRFYLINLDDLLKFAQTRVTRTLSPGECQRYLGKPSC